MNPKIISELGDYLLTHEEQVVSGWIQAVKREPFITSLEHLDRENVVDHLPELCQDLAALLKSAQPEQVRREVFDTARRHGRVRWGQGYRLEEVIREASIIRRIFLYDWGEAFAREESQFPGEN